MCVCVWGGGGLLPCLFVLFCSLVLCLLFNFIFQFYFIFSCSFLTFLFPPFFSFFSFFPFFFGGGGGGVGGGFNLGCIQTYDSTFISPLFLLLPCLSFVFFCLFVLSLLVCMLLFFLSSFRFVLISDLFFFFKL